MHEPVYRGAGIANGNGDREQSDPSIPGDFYITFHLDNRQEVFYSLVDMTGRLLTTTQLTDVLNQTYTLQPLVSAGIYLLRIQIGQDIYTSRVFIDQ